MATLDRWEKQDNQDQAGRDVAGLVEIITDLRNSAAEHERERDEALDLLRQVYVLEGGALPPELYDRVGDLVG